MWNPAARTGFLLSDEFSERTLIRRYLLNALVIGTLLGTAGFAAAQDTVVVQPGQQTVVKEYVHKHPLASINILGLELSAGSVLPDTVELHKVEVPDVQYEYVVVNDHTVLVDPRTRQIVEVVQ